MTHNVSQAILEMSSKGRRLCWCNIKKGELIGIITDGDLRRHMTKNLLEKKAKDIMTKNPKTLSPSTLVSEALNHDE